MSLRGVFITGSDTDAGKTVVTAGLLRALQQAGVPALAVKPVQTGVASPADSAADAPRYLEALGSAPEGVESRVRTLQHFSLPASPCLAAREEGRRVDVAGLVAQIRALPEAFLVLEGAGGVLVPLNARESMLDLMEALDLPVLLAVRNRVGAVNHALLSLRALHDAGLHVAGVVMVQADPCPDDERRCLPLRDNVRFLREHADVPHLWEVPYCAALSSSAAPEAVGAAWQTVADALAPALPHVSGSEDAFPRAEEKEDAAALLEWDRRHLWHPYTSASHPLPVLEVVRTEGTRIRLRDGRALVDGMSSWWCAVHGYGNRRMVQAARRQAGRMAHVMFGGLTHAPAVRLGQKLLPLLPQGLTHIFLADSGSVAVEVALKMALQLQQAQGHAGRTRMLAPRGGYHGDTFGAMSVCDPVTGMHSLFRNMLAQQIFVPRPSCRFDAPFDPASMEPVEAALKAHAGELAAVILEPVVQGAGGMWLYHPEYLRRLRALCDAHGPLLVFDEIATGFGRTGKLFAAEWASVTPDILCLGKALTGGFMTLSGVACTDAVARGISADGNVFMHGPTFMGNPLACAVAEASLDELLASPWQENVARLEHGLRCGLAPCAGLPGVADVRVLGGIGVVETESPVPVEALQRFFVEQGVWIRPFARLIYLMPPFVATEEDVRLLTSAVTRAVREGVHLSD